MIYQFYVSTIRLKNLFILTNHARSSSWATQSLDKGQRTYKINEKQWKCYEVYLGQLTILERAQHYNVQIFIFGFKRVNYMR